MQASAIARGAIEARIPTIIAAHIPLSMVGSMTSIAPKYRINTSTAATIDSAIPMTMATNIAISIDQLGSINQ